MTKPTNWPRLNLAAGPVEVTSQTLRDMARPVLYHYDPAFIELFARTSGLLQQVFRTEYDVVIMQGEAILGLEAAAAGLISPGDKVLNLVSGVFGKWFEDFIDKVRRRDDRAGRPLRRRHRPGGRAQGAARQPGREVPLRRPLRDAVRHAQSRQGHRRRRPRVWRPDDGRHGLRSRRRAAQPRRRGAWTSPSPDRRSASAARPASP